jgi:hypothetical protein
MDWLTAATLLLSCVTAIVAFATWRLGTRASDETKAQWRPATPMQS